MKQFIRPAFLKKGDTVAVLAPASSVSNEYQAPEARWRKVIESWGLKIKTGDHLFDTLQGEFAGTDGNRAKDIEDALRDPEVKAILCYRGGYGSMRTCLETNLELFRQNPKWLVGFSDITVFHTILHDLEIESILGPMCFSYGTDSVAEKYLHDALFGKKLEYHTDPHPLSSFGQATGRLAGGNLCLYHSTLPTEWANRLEEPSILLIEDVEESMHSIDRMLTTMRAAGILQRAKGIIVGHFTDTSEQEKWGRDVYKMISEHTGSLGCPVLFGFPCGHETPNYSMYMGREIRLTVDEKGGHVEFI